MPKGRIVGKAGRARRAASVEEFVVDVGITERLKQKGVTTEEVFRIVAPRRTLDRRKAEGGKLSLAESDRALRVERIAEHAERVFGNPEKAQRWLRKPNRALDGAIPMDLLASETGAHRVDEVLHRIDFGMYS
jgi:putative toxin-antitoxin system antitoxin component (TIGR02293 family)